MNEDITPMTQKWEIGDLVWVAVLTDSKLVAGIITSMDSDGIFFRVMWSSGLESSFSVDDEFKSNYTYERAKSQLKHYQDWCSGG